jgi:hypothetical protein
LEGFRLPAVGVLNLFTSAYMSGLNQHLPFLHLPSLDLNQMDVALLLSICSIGALYCFEKEQARKLHEAADVFLTEVSLRWPLQSVGYSTYGVDYRSSMRRRATRTCRRRHCKLFYYVSYSRHGVVRRVCSSEIWVYIQFWLMYHLPEIFLTVGLEDEMFIDAKNTSKTSLTIGRLDQRRRISAVRF